MAEIGFYHLTRSDFYAALPALLASGRVVYLTQRSYDAGELARTVPAQHVDTVSIVGDVFALPLADALDRAARNGHPYDVSSLRRILSVGVTIGAAMAFGPVETLTRRVEAKTLSGANFLALKLRPIVRGGSQERMPPGPNSPTPVPLAPRSCAY